MLSYNFECSNSSIWFQQRASGKKFQEILEEAFIRPLKIEGELYVGIPPGKCVDCAGDQMCFDFASVVGIG